MTLAAIFLALTMWGRPLFVLDDPRQFRAPDPIDVPAIQYTRPASHPCNVDTGNFTVCMTTDETVWTCADKSRVLLIAEDGSKHCIKFH